MNLLRLWGHIRPLRKKQFIKLLILMLIVSMFEIASIGAVLPFLAALINAETIFLSNTFNPLVKLMNLQSATELTFLLTIVFAMTAVLAGAMRTFLVWATTRLSLTTCADISSDIYMRTIFQSYEVHISRNSSEVINGVMSQTNSVIYDTVMPSMMLISSIIISSIILVALIYYNPIVALFTSVTFGLIYTAVGIITKKKLQSNSKILARESTKMIQVVQEGLGAIRDIILDGSQVIYWQIYQQSNIPLRRVQASIAFIGNSPRYAIEALGVAFIAVLAFVFNQSGQQELVITLPFLGALALAAQRLLPLFQQAYSSWSFIKGGEETLADILRLLDQPIQNITEQNIRPTLKFNNQIQLNAITFRYSPELPLVLNNIDLIISKGDRIGIIGKTGSGKSTLLDVLMGLLVPTEGRIFVDEKVLDRENIGLWQGQIAHVPQMIFLADCSILENIAFGVSKDKIDRERVYECARLTKMAEVIELWPNRYETNVGERGVRLSGGQRQRIGIARALYKKASVIVLDEATSSLDNETENDIMNAIEELGENLTFLIIAHRLSTLKKCTKIIEMVNGNVSLTNL